MTPTTITERNFPNYATSPKTKIIERAPRPPPQSSRDVKSESDALPELPQDAPAAPRLPTLRTLRGRRNFHRRTKTRRAQKEIARARQHIAARSEETNGATRAKGNNNEDEEVWQSCALARHARPLFVISDFRFAILDCRLCQSAI